MYGLAQAFQCPQPTASHCAVTSSWQMKNLGKRCTAPCVSSNYSQSGSDRGNLLYDQHWFNNVTLLCKILLLSVVLTQFKLPLQFNFFNRPKLKVRIVTTMRTYTDTPSRVEGAKKLDWDSDSGSLSQCPSTIMHSAWILRLPGENRWFGSDLNLTGCRGNAAIGRLAGGLGRPLRVPAGARLCIVNRLLPVHILHSISLLSRQNWKNWTKQSVFILLRCFVFVGGGLTLFNFSIQG